MMPKGSQNGSQNGPKIKKIIKKRGSKIDAKIDAKKGAKRGPRGTLPWPPEQLQINKIPTEGNLLEDNLPVHNLLTRR